MTAVFEDRGRQYKVKKDDVIYIDRMETKDGELIEFSNVLLASGDDVKIGAPYVANAKVKARVVETLLKDKKVIVFKFKRRKNYKRTRGHRQQYTVVKIEEIIA